MGEVERYSDAIQHILNELIESSLYDRKTEIRQWQYPIIQKMKKCYSYENAQKLLVFSYNISRHNIEVENGDPNPIPINPPLFNIVVDVNTRIGASIVNVAYLFYSEKLDMIIICFTGTYNRALWLIDLDYPQVVPVGINNYVEGIKIHGGFWRLYSAVNSRIYKFLEKYKNKRTQVLITGISLGGAMSSICAYDLHDRKSNIIHYSFASPRVFNTFGANYYDYLHMFSYRIINGSDIVPMLPLPIMPVNEDFTHVNEQIYFNMNLGNYRDNHITAYLTEYNVAITQ